MLRIVQAAGVDEVGVFTAQALRLGVHLVHKSVHRAGDHLRQDVAGLVGRLDHDAVQQLLHRQLFPDFDASGAGIGSEQVDGGLGGGDGLVQGDVAPVHGLEHQQHRHALGDAGGVKLLVGVLVQQDLPRVAVHQQGGFGGHRRIGKGRRVLLCGGGRHGQQTGQKEHDQKN